MELLLLAKHEIFIKKFDYSIYVVPQTRPFLDFINYSLKNCSHYEIFCSLYIKSFTMEVLTNKEVIYMKNMTNQTVQTYKGGTRS